MNLWIAFLRIDLHRTQSSKAMKLVAKITLLLFLMLGSRQGWADLRSEVENDSIVFMAGAAYANITPSKEVKNWITGESYPNVRDSIYARVLVLSDGSQKFVILHWELVDAGESATDRVRAEIGAALDISPGNILVNAAHNHSAPWSPVYGEDNRRGEERYPWWVTRHMPAQDEDPYFREWKEQLIRQSVKAAREAEKALEPVSIWIGRYDVSRFLYNRRPWPMVEKPVESGWPGRFTFDHEDWDPLVLTGDQTFGPVDRTMTVVSLRNERNENISSIFHLSCHAVSIYPYLDDLSGDWPGAVTRRINGDLGGSNLFLQGTAGDIAPWRRGEYAVEEMAEGLATDIRKTYQYSARFSSRPLSLGRSFVGIPLTEYARSHTGLNTLQAEIQAVVIGPLAIITLPGEPMTGLGERIRENSPFDQTIVLGYSNGNGGHYCGMPGEKAKGGYETGEKTNLGTDRAGLMMTETAIELLHELYQSR